MAFLAASLICCGVSKSGSPRLRSMTSTPLALNSRPSLAIFNVSGSLKRERIDDNCIFNKIKRREDKTQELKKTLSLHSLKKINETSNESTGKYFCCFIDHHFSVPTKLYLVCQQT